MAYDDMFHTCSILTVILKLQPFQVTQSGTAPRPQELLHVEADKESTVTWVLPWK